MVSPLNIAVVGAGIIGLSTALWLQRAGLKVTLIDKSEPGVGTSFGNAGLFADYGRLPMASFEQLCKIPGMLIDKSSPLSVQPSYAKKLIPYAWHFVKACRSSSYAHGRDVLTALQILAPEADNVLLRETGAEYLVQSKGCLALYGTAESLQAAYSGELRERLEQGVRMESLSSGEVSELEPDLAPFHSGGVLYPDTRFTVSPIALSRCYVRAFCENGGRLLSENIVSITDNSEMCSLQSPQNTYQFDRVVICTGVAGSLLTQQLGCKVPLVSERGYHLMLNAQEWGISRPVGWHDRAVFMSPMEDGVRIAGMAEFAKPGALEGEAKKVWMLDSAIKMMGKVPDVTSTWVGSRPSTPDSLPVIGPIAGHDKVLVAYGHGHLGLTLSAVTGQLVAECIVGKPNQTLLAALSPSRFNQ
ncbi:FAD-binding oxidoreductase [Pseudomonas sp. M30-35]|uniref:NAD(P)/FAD-dependent oxidoreductase n=1 Tax=Pseudomonas sp. M30-35 TaxID=1981174 RepID=UPI000B3C312D|nr:FAD-dependent oxidoreductase [Pseudomonas sp. M30-35]ARU88766.1 amino acid dehydrogenase [Pseudomonas sp. M30-35]